MATSGTSSDDEALVTRLRAGDMDALRELMRIHSAKLLTVAEITTGSLDLADETVQEVFIQLWDRRTTLDPSENILGLLITITRRRAINLLHHEQMHSRITRNLERVYSAHDTAASNEGELAIESDEADAVLQKAIAELSPRSREIFLLHREAGLGYAEIEKLLGMSNGAVRVQISRAGAHIGRAIRSWMKGE